LIECLASCSATRRHRRRSATLTLTSTRCAAPRWLGWQWWGSLVICGSKKLAAIEINSSIVGNATSLVTPEEEGHKRLFTVVRQTDRNTFLVSKERIARPPDSAWRRICVFDHLVPRGRWPALSLRTLRRVSHRGDRSRGPIRHGKPALFHPSHRSDAMAPETHALSTTNGPFCDPRSSVSILIGKPIPRPDWFCAGTGAPRLPEGCFHLGA